MPNRASRNPLAITALVFGILSLCGGVLAPVGMILGYFALRQAKRNYDAGATQARAAIILSCVGVAATTPILLIVLRFSHLSD